MKCRFCVNEETAVVQLAVWDRTRQGVDELLLQGVCADHSGASYKDASEMPDVYRKRFAVLRDHYIAQGGVEANTLQWGIAFFPLDSAQGRRVRMVRLGMSDPNERRIEKPKIETDRVSTEEWCEAMQIPMAGKGKIVSGAGGKK
jgi:hypothetical protein